MEFNLTFRKNKRAYLLVFLISIGSLYAHAQSITGFTLINADTDLDLFQISNGQRINIQELPTANLNIRADVSGTIGSAAFFLNGSFIRTENVSPYALNGDKSGDYTGLPPELGTNQLQVIAYPNSGAGGVALDTASISILFVDEPTEIFVTNVEFVNCPTSPLTVGDQIDLDVLITPASATNQTIAFTASDGTSVDFLSGEFTAQAPGTITVTATSFSDGAVFDQCTIEIIDIQPPIDPYETVQAEDFSAQSGIQLAGDGSRVGFINNNDFIRFDNVQFGRGPVSGVLAGASDRQGGTVEFRTGAVDGPLLAKTTITNTGGWSTFQDFVIDVPNATDYQNGTIFLGTETLFLVFKGGGGFLFDVDQFRFNSSDILVTDISFTNCPTEPLSVGDFIDLDVLITPSNAVNQTIAFAASDGSSVDFLSGEFTAAAPGQITVTATSFSDGSVTDQCIISIVDTIPPSAPSNLVGSAIDQGIVNLSWSDNSDNETAFEIEASYESGPWNVVGTVPADSTFFQDMGLGMEWSGNYRVKAVNQFGASENSNLVYVSNFPVPPTNFRADSITETSIFLAWDAPAYGNDYLIEFTTNLDEGFQYFDALYFGFDELEYGGFDVGETYYFRMRTNFDGSPSLWTDILEVTTLSNQQSISALVLVDSDSNLDIQTLTDGDTLNFFYLPSRNLNVRAETLPDLVGSVGFAYDGNADFSTENITPYALTGDAAGDYNPWTPTLGSHTLTATPYTAPNRGGDTGNPKTVNFVVIDQDTTTTPPDTVGGPPAMVTGELKKWHKVTLSFEGIETSEAATDNPFANYRLLVTFSHGSRSYTVPGFYAADGQAENSSASSGNIWQAHFAPDAIGTWTYTASFRQGTDIAISTDPTAGSPTAFDGETGTFVIGPSDKSGRDFRSTGRLEYVGEHYLQFAETGDFFFKVGADAPENTFAYEDFDATPNKAGRRKSWAPHAGDFDLADAAEFTWGTLQSDGGRAGGRELLGALKYLSDEGMNVFSFLTFSLDGDDDNIYPHLQIVSDATSWNDVHHDRFDVSKLAQWEKILEYADKKGVYMHFKTQETENDQKMDAGQLGRERKLYYRELVARFGHHLALNWNLGEENDIWQELNDPNNDIVRSYTQYLNDIDPYNHNIVIHSYPGQQDEVYGPLLGASSELTGTSIQTGGNLNEVHTSVKKWVQESNASYKKWVVACDEPGSAQLGTGVDAAYPDSQLPEPRNNGDNRDAIRKQVLWGTMLAGGAGVEYYYGYQTGCDDLDCEDHRTRQTKWEDAIIALDFFNNHLQPYVTTMVSADGLTADNDDYVLARTGEIYLVYRPNGGAFTLNLSGQSGTYSVQWYDPQNGGDLQSGSLVTVEGGSAVSIGLPPYDTSRDWVALITNSSGGTFARQSSGEVSNIDDELSIDGIQFYPNPVKDVLVIQSNLEGEQMVQILDLNGKVLSTKVVQDTGEVKLDMSSIQSGIYLLKVRHENTQKQFRIFKQ